MIEAMELVLASGGVLWLARFWVIGLALLGLGIAAAALTARPGPSRPLAETHPLATSWEQALVSSGTVASPALRS